MKKLIASIENKRNVDDAKRLTNDLFIRSGIDYNDLKNQDVSGLLNILHSEVNRCLSFKGLFLVDYDITHRKMVVRCKSSIYSSNQAITINRNGVRFCPKLDHETLAPFIIGLHTWVEWMSIRSKYSHYLKG